MLFAGAEGVGWGGGTGLVVVSGDRGGGAGTFTCAGLECPQALKNRIVIKPIRSIPVARK